jgi:hypothetical protein
LRHYAEKCLLSRKENLLSKVYQAVPDAVPAKAAVNLMTIKKGQAYGLTLVR